MTTTNVPLARLYIHPLNTRSEPPPAEIDLLAESIRSAGLLQNLMGYADPDGGFADDRDLQTRRVGIVAGGRRLRALQALYAAQRDYTVPVLITQDADVAAEWAGAENSARAALNPADEIEAYRRMRARGSSPQQIAAVFAVRESHVHGRLKLSTLPVEVIDALRAAQISLDQAAALTTAPSDDAAVDLLPAILRRQDTYGAMTPADIRRALNPAAVKLSDRRAIFVGLEYYLARGGRTQTDLFADTTVMLDPDILDTCFAEALEQARQTTLAEGWANVIATPDPWPAHDAISAAGRPIERQQLDLPPGDQAELDDLRTADDLTDDQLARMDALEARTLGDFADEDRAAATAFIHVNARGELVFDGARRPRETAADTGTDAATATTTPAETIPGNLRDDLAIIATLSLQTALLEKPELVLDLLAMCFDPALPAWGRPLAISPAPQPITPSKPDDCHIDARLQDADGIGRAELSIDMLAALQAAGKKARNAAITAGLARTLNVARSDFGRALGALLQVNPRTVWHPTAENYFRRLPAGMLDEIWHDLVPDDQISAPGITTLKKGDKAKQLEKLFHDADFRESIGLSRAQNARIDAWLPPELRFGNGGAQ